MITLYVKTHNKTGLKYLGKTTQDPFKYKGSGKYWIRHLQAHGNDVTTEIIFQTTDPVAFREFSTEYSITHNVMESHEWANLIPETGHGGNSPLCQTPSAKAKSAETRRKNNKTWTQTEESNIKRSISHMGKHISQDTIAKMVATKKANGYSPTAETRQKISEANKGRAKPFTDEHKQNLRCHVNNSTQVTCPHCGKTGQLTNMKRWHFDHCKLIPK